MTAEDDLNMEAIPPEYELDPTIQTAKLGIEAEVFFHSALGRHIINRASHDVSIATQKLVDADPDDAKLNRDIRNQIEAPKRALHWIKDAVRQGELARVQLAEDDAEQ